MAIELDISKAYDKVDWNFLEAFMSTMSFEGSLLRLIMNYI